MVSRIPRLLLLVAMAAFIAPAALAAQVTARPGVGEVFGTIVDAQNEAPLAGTLVTLEPADSHLPRGATTDAEGRYRFTGLAPGTYRLRVQRLGYVAGNVDVLLQGPASAAVSVALRVEPVRLEPLAATGSIPAAAANGFQGDDGDADAADRARLEAERMRQRTHLAPDVRLVTLMDVEQAVPLAESDLFRGIQRMAGVTARDEYSAELLTRGGMWDQTRVYFDGVPLYNPLHASALFAAPSTEAVGGVLLFPGAQPLGTGGGAAAALELRSRSGSDGVLGGSAELSPASGRLALDGAAGPVRWMMSVRHSNPLRLMDDVEARSRGEDVWNTRHFTDASARMDVRLGERSAIEASAFFQEDVLEDGPESDWVRLANAHWGNFAGRATLRLPVRGLDGRFTGGISNFNASTSDNSSGEPRESGLVSWPTILHTRSLVRHILAEGQVQPPARSGTQPPWSAGAGVALLAVSYAGPPVYPLDSLLPPLGVHRAGTFTHAYAWGERRWKPAPRWTLEAGARVEAGGRAESTPALRVGPRVAARWQASPAFSVSAAAGRSWHAVQAGPELQEQSITQHLWLLADDEIPALRSDVATLGAERWLGERWLVSATAWARRTGGLVLRDPLPGAVMGRDAFVTGHLTAYGAEASARKIAGAWTAAAALSWGHATAHAGRFSWAAESDQRYSLDLESGIRLPAGFRVDAAFTATGGGAFTRFFGGLATCTNGVCTWQEMPRAGTPGGLRAPAFASLDLSAAWTHRFGGVRVTTWAQLHNALGRDNPARYHHSTLYLQCGFGQPDPAGGCIDDVFGRGLPRLPLAGLRIEL